MECNKEEAIRAKSIAERRMQNQDFEGALKIALTAQRLFPDLENISQILTVCQVLCAEATKIGGETDWYAVLQVEMTANEPSIRKQYRKLALLLHPDKNKLPGSEAAFQLIGDAYKILSDPKKRSQHDVIRRANFSRVSLNIAPQQSYRPAKKQPGPGVSNMAAKTNLAHFSGLNQNQPSPFLGVGAFWTICPSCSVRFQYYQNVLNKEVRCQRCFNRFVAYDLKMQGENCNGDSEKFVNTNPSTCQKSDFTDSSAMESQRAKSDYSTLNQGFKPEHSTDSFDESKSNLRDEKFDETFQKVQFPSNHNSDLETKPLVNHKRRGIADNQTLEPSTGKTSNILRKSGRHKQNADCNEVQGSDIDSFFPASKRLKRQGKKQANLVQKNKAFSGSITAEKMEENGNGSFHSELNASVVSRCKTSVNLKKLAYPSQEFCEFESERLENKFAVDQIWALYDSIDGMPRIYARVKKVYSREFKIQLNLLENDPRTIAEMKWSEQRLPVASGSFKHGKLYNTNDRRTFSHLVQWKIGMKRNSYIIYPRIGEIWALFRNWDIRWSSEPDNHRAYEYQIVEVVSDFTEVAGVNVIRLTKIKEYNALFVRSSDAEESLLEIPTRDALMFSHRIPACRITGKEEDGIPEGAFELDCASLPSNFQETFPSISIGSKARMSNASVVCNDVSCENEIPPSSKENEIEFNAKDAIMEKWKSGTGGSASKKMNGASNKTMHINSQDTSTALQKTRESEILTLRNEAIAKADNICSQNPDIEHHSDPPSLPVLEYPNSEFHDFESDRFTEKFESGQVWAFYCEIDNFPKYYGRIGKVDREKNKVNLRWLEYYSALNVDDHQDDDKPPRACGTFRATKERCTVDLNGTVSHQVKAKPMPTKDHYFIHPDVGEIWAVFKNWSPNWSASDLQKSEFEVVQISACDANGIKASVLTKTNGYVSVFRREKKGLNRLKFIPSHEFGRFSHQIPAFRLGKQMRGDGYLELDPAAVPTVFLSSK